MSLLDPKNLIKDYTTMEAAAKIVDFRVYSHRTIGLTKSPWERIEVRRNELSSCYKSLCQDADFERFYPEAYSNLKKELERETYLLQKKQYAMSIYHKKIMRDVSSNFEINTPTPLVIRYKKYDTNGQIDYAACLLTVTSLKAWCEENGIETDAFNTEHEKTRYKAPPETNITIRSLEDWIKDNEFETNLFLTEKQKSKNKQYREHELLEVLFELEAVKNTIKNKITIEEKTETNNTAHTLKEVLNSLESLTKLAKRDTMINIKRLKDLNSFNLELAAKERQINDKINNTPVSSDEQRPKPQVNDSIGTTEKKNLLKTIGSLASALADCYISSKYGTKKAVNQLSIAKTLIKDYPPNDPYGFSERSLTTRLSNGEKELNN